MVYTRGVARAMPYFWDRECGIYRRGCVSRKRGFLYFLSFSFNLLSLFLFLKVEVEKNIYNIYLALGLCGTLTYNTRLPGNSVTGRCNLTVTAKIFEGTYIFTAFIGM